MKSEAGEDFLLSRGAPFFELQRQLGLLSRRSLNSGPRAVLGITLTGGVPLLLALLFGERGDFLRMLQNPGFMTRFVLFVAICFLMERTLEERVRGFLLRFAESGLLDDAARTKGAHAVTRALRLRDDWIAELVCLALAVGLTLLSLQTQIQTGEQAWLTTSAEEGSGLTAAGWWVVVVSSPIFWFLVFRWLWRITVWGVLLFWISRLDLRLVATHPDKAGGIGFIGIYPNSFVPLVLGLSSVVAAAVYAQLDEGGIDAATYGKLMTAWLALVLAVFSLPLLAFMTPLGRLKNETLRQADIQATRIQRAAERKTFGRNLVAPDETEPETADLADPNDFRKAAAGLNTVPFSRRALLPLGAAALAPLLIAGATLLPFKELLGAAKALLVL